MKNAMKWSVLSSLFLCMFTSYTQTDSLSRQEEPKKIKTSWTFGALPSVSYDADLGFQYGALANVYYYGDGSTYPEYLHSFYVEAAYTTKNYGLFRFFYDSKYLIPKHRLTVDISYLPDAMCDFFGYNGYQSVYNDTWRNSKKYTVAEGYKSRAFYKYKRDIFRFAADMQGTIYHKWKWNAGLGLLYYNIDVVDIAMLNKGKKQENLLPDTIQGLYEKYIDWGIIHPKEQNGGVHPYIRGGITYDSRNKESNPSKGIYADAFLTYTAAFGQQKDYNNLKLNANFRHYVPIYKDYIALAYRVGTQLLIAGKSPFYTNNYMNTLYIQRVLYEGLGGGNSLRGILRNRILANGFAFSNIELRLKVWKFDIGKQHFYLGFNPFFDIGMITQAYDFEEDHINSVMAVNNPEDDPADYFDFDKSSIYRPHMSAGIGLKVAMNENFILSVDWAVPFDKQDGAGLSNLYVKIGYLF
ncbi:MAG: BamA/TamA family outer membrane protein [Bacteroidales bacterium]|nr:BamA/TamA family outer membrane protein [Bacteroidales bacterium]